MNLPVQNTYVMQELIEILMGILNLLSNVVDLKNKLSCDNPEGK